MSKQLDGYQQSLAGLIRGVESEPVRQKPRLKLQRRQALMTQAEYARSRKARGLPGGTRGAVQRAVQSGRIGHWGKEMLLEPNQADAEWQRNTRARLETSVKQKAAALKPDVSAALTQRGRGEAGSPTGDNSAVVTDEALQGPMRHAVQLAAGKWNDEALTWVQEYLAAWINARGTVPLERCAHLPRTASGVRKAHRNVWLAKAVSAMEGDSLMQRCKALRKRLNDFLSRGEWRAWKARREPPASADALAVALFYIAKGTPGDKVLSAMQMCRILR